MVSHPTDAHQNNDDLTDLNRAIPCRPSLWTKNGLMYRNVIRLPRSYLLCHLVMIAIALRAAGFSWNARLRGDVSLCFLTAREFVEHDRLFYPYKWKLGEAVPYKALAMPASQHPLLWPFAAGLLSKPLGSDATFITL